MDWPPAPLFFYNRVWNTTLYLRGRVCSILLSLSIFLSIFLSLPFRLFLCCWVCAPANSPWRDMPQVGIITSEASGAHLLHTPTKGKIVWNFPNLLSAFQCQLHLCRNELNELLPPLPTDEYLQFFSTSLENRINQSWQMVERWTARQW